MTYPTRIADGAHSPHTRQALRDSRAREEQLELEDFIEQLKFISEGHVA